MLEAVHEGTVLVDEIQQAADRHLAQGLKNGMVDPLTTGRILQRPVRVSPMAFESRKL